MLTFLRERAKIQLGLVLLFCQSIKSKRVNLSELHFMRKLPMALILVALPNELKSATPGDYAAKCPELCVQYENNSPTAKVLGNWFGNRSARQTEDT